MPIPKVEREAKGILLSVYVIACSPLSDDIISNKNSVHSITNAESETKLMMCCVT